MLRFRPIAPKPATGSSSSSVDPTVKKITRGRPKRKYERAKKGNTKCENNKHEVDPTVTTLQLFPNPTMSGGELDPTVEKLPINLTSDFNRFIDKCSTVRFFNGADQADPRVAKSVVTVESVTDVCTVGGLVELGRTDEERVKNLEHDTCPSFVTDSYNRVRVMWTNYAFSQMMCTNDVSSVTMIVKAELPEYPAFACVVRVQMPDTRMGPTSSASRVLPCDVWRMDFGGLAWRLDLRAALSLGL